VWQGRTGRFPEVGAVETPESFARELDRLRRASGKSYRHLAAESGLGFNTISGYCGGRHLPQPAVEAEFSRLLTAVGVSNSGQDHWFRALHGLRGRSTGRRTAWNPYPGLRAFQPEDAELFFGRDELADRVLREVASSSRPGQALVVAGPSGSGKSSLLRAGVVPRLGSSVIMTPGAEPARAWREAVAKLDDAAVVVVDQFEELFTQCGADEERQEFLGLLHGRSGPVILGLRADYYDQALRYPLLAGDLQSAHVVVEPMTKEQLRDAIVEPARIAGVALENGLVELLLRDAAAESGSLPLLSHTLHVVTESARRAGSVVPVGIAQYLASGGVHGAVARTADMAYRSLTGSQRMLARNLLVRMVALDNGIADTRRRVGFDELFDGRAPDEAEDLTGVVDTFVRCRLLTSDTAGVEISHEALLSAWPRMREWLADDRLGRRIHGKLTVAARDWRDEGYPADYTGPARRAHRPRPPATPGSRAHRASRRGQRDLLSIRTPANSPSAASTGPSGCGN
jgi:energy-coupling factor transporter ATP-binding protein EcfA2